MEKSALQSAGVRPLVLLPSFNNAATLGAVLHGVFASVPRGTRVVVVNDGSTDETTSVLHAFPEAVTLTHACNLGKGEAILTGFRYALQNGFSHVVTIDTDGQHRPSDLEHFLTAIAREPDSIWLGDRGLLKKTVAHAPASSIFGCRFSNWWVKVETGLELPDTQTGYRAYPLAKLPLSALSAQRFDFEIEVIVRSAWAKVALRSLPVDVVYPPAGERVSHFHPWRDNLRLTRMHTRLCVSRLLALLAAPLARFQRASA